MLGADGHYYNWLYGRERPGTSVTVTLAGDAVHVVADAHGFWLRVQQDDDTTTQLRRPT